MIVSEGHQKRSSPTAGSIPRYAVHSRSFSTANVRSGLAAGSQPHTTPNTPRPLPNLGLQPRSKDTRPLPKIHPQPRSTVNSRSIVPPSESRRLLTVGSRLRPPSSFHSKFTSRHLPDSPQERSMRDSHNSAISPSQLRIGTLDSPTRSRAVSITQSQSPTSGAFNNAHHVVLNNPTFMDGIHPNEKTCIDLLAQNIIPGAQFDSGERYPPPSCHPGTRIDISRKIVSWTRDLRGPHKVLWLHGPAGVGKSAVIQTLAESEAGSPVSILGATLFFSRTNKRDDPQRVFTTIAYQLAVKYPAYRAYIVDLLTLDPLLVRKSLVKQFELLIIKPFTEKEFLERFHETILITLDGLDECKSELAQREIVLLVGKFCLQNPTSPLIWIIATRPEPHIRNAFSHQDVQGVYLEMDMPVNSDQACIDVERYLRDKFVEIKDNYSTYFSSNEQWPTETDFATTAKHSSGLFAFASTIIRFIDDPECAHPVSQLDKVLDALKSTSSGSVGDAPFAALDTIYTLILSSVSPKLLPITRKLLMIMESFASFAFACNMLSINQADAYCTLRKLHSVLDIPRPELAHKRTCQAFHASFHDYLKSPSRSGPFWIDPLDARNVVSSAYVRILLEAHSAHERPPVGDDGISTPPVESMVRISNIIVSWPSSVVWEQQKSLFYDSLYAVLRVPPESIKIFDTLHYFFRDIDYANFGSLSPTPKFAARIADMFLESALLARFKEWGVVTTVPIQSLDLASIGSNDPTHVYSCRPGLPEEGDPAWEEAYLPRSISQHIFSSNLQAVRATWRRKIIVLGDEPHWRTRIHQQLTELPPSHSVTVLGGGDKICVLVGIDNPERLWFYMLPFIRS